MDAFAAAAAVAAAAEGGMNPDRWSDMAVHVAEALGADTGSFWVVGLDGSMTRLCPRTDPEWHRRYDADMHRLNYFWDLASVSPAGAVISDTTVGRSRYLRSGIYNEFIRPQRMDATLTFSLSGPARADKALLTLGRRTGKEGFGRTEVDAARVLAEALARTLAVTGVRAGPSGQTGPDEAPTLLVTPGGRIVARGPSLETLLVAGDVVVRDGLVEAPAVAGLAAAIRGAGRDPRAWPPPIAALLGPVAMSIGAVTVEVTPGGRAAPGAVRIRFRPGRRREPPGEIRQAFGLTERECEIALLLAAGCGLPEIGGRLGIGLTTARTHLGRLFDKTGTRSQLALALLLSRRLGGSG